VTAALPQSLARLDNVCRSSEMRSIAASMLEFNNSTSSTSSTETISNTRSIAPTGINTAQGSKTAARAIS
jgi:hypothetical protein